MGGGGGSGHLTRTYRGGRVSLPGFGHKTIVPTNSGSIRNSIDAITERHLFKIEVPGPQSLRLGNLKDQISDALSKDFGIEKVSVIGSVAKGTQIKNKRGNDIDTLFVLDKKQHGAWLNQEGGHRICLERIKRALQKDPRFRNVELRVDRNVVTAYLGNERVDIIPAFENPKGGYYIPDTYGKGGWIESNPRLEARLFRNLDSKYNGNVIKMTKIVKDWNQRNGANLSSNHINCMVYDFFRYNKPKDGENSHKANVREFYERMPEYLRHHVKDPVYGNPSDSYLGDKERRGAIGKAQKSANLLKKMDDEAMQGHQNQSEEHYRKFLGE